MDAKKFVANNSSSGLVGENGVVCKNNKGKKSVLVFFSRVLTKKKKAHTIGGGGGPFLRKQKADELHRHRGKQKPKLVWVHQLRSRYDLGQGTSPFSDFSIFSSER